MGQVLCIGSNLVVGGVGCGTMVVALGLIELLVTLEVHHTEQRGRTFLGSGLVV